MTENNCAHAIMEHIENMSDGSSIPNLIKESFCRILLSAFSYLNSEFTQE